MPLVLARLVLAFVLAVPPFLQLIAPSLDSDQPFTLVIRLSSSTAGSLAVFADVGRGYGPDNVTILPTYVSDEARDYHIPFKVGEYESLRIDPGIGPGRYTIERLYFVDGAGQVVAPIPLTGLIPAYHLRLVERSAERAVFECPGDGYDPQIIYRPSTPMWLLPKTQTVGTFARWFTLYLAVAFALLWLGQLALGAASPSIARGLEAVGRGAAENPHVAVLIAAVLATSVAMYPLLFVGRSLVSPNNGGVAMLYDHAPYSPDSSDMEIEDVRGVDVGATPWAFVPYSVAQRWALASGEWPLWNRYAGPGLPLWGQGQTFLGDPLHWLTLIQPDPTAGWDLKFAAHRLVLAWGVGVAALTITGAWLPSAIAASTAPFVGMFAFRLNHPGSFMLTYAPWVLVGWIFMAKATTNRQRASSCVLLTIASALVLVASPPKEGSMIVLVTEIIGLLALVFHLGIGRPFARALLFAVLAGAATVLITMPHWLVFLDTLHATRTFYDVPGVMFANPRFALAMIIGPLADGMPLPAITLLSMALVVAVLLSPVRVARHPAALACVFGAAGALAVAFGAIPAAWLVRIPLVGNIISISVTFLAIAIVPLLICSAVGAAAILESSPAKAAAITLGVAWVGLWVFRGTNALASLGLFRGWLILLAIVGAVLAPLTMRAAARQFPRVLPAVAAVALALLLLAPGGQHLETSIPPLNSSLVQPRLRMPMSGTSPTVDAIVKSSDEPVRTVGLGNLMIAGSQALYGLEGVSGPDALVHRTADELIVTRGERYREGWRHVFMPQNLEADAPLLDMLNVGYVLARFTEAAALGRPVPVSVPDAVLAIRRLTAWPRAFFVDRVGTYDTPADLLAQARDAHRPIASIQVGDANAEEITRGTARGAGEVVRADRYALTANSTYFHVRAPRSGIAVLAESYMADEFIVTLNGRPVPYFRVNHAFKGVTIPDAGDWHVRFEYRPKHWSLALVAAVAGVALLIIMTVTTVRAETSEKASIP